MPPADAGTSSGTGNGSADAPDLPALIAAIEVGHRALAEAIPLAAETWERARPPRGDEAEVWTPREVAEHVIGAELRFAGMIAIATGLPAPSAPPELGYADAAAATDARMRVAAAVQPLLERLIPDHLDAPTEFADNVAGVLRIAAWHLRDHAQQMLGVQDARSR